MTFKLPNTVLFAPCHEPALGTQLYSDV